MQLTITCMHFATMATAAIAGALGVGAYAFRFNFQRRWAHLALGFGVLAIVAAILQPYAVGFTCSL